MKKASPPRCGDQFQSGKADAESAIHPEQKGGEDSEDAVRDR